MNIWKALEAIQLHNLPYCYGAGYEEIFKAKGFKRCPYCGCHYKGMTK